MWFSVCFWNLSVHLWLNFPGNDSVFSSAYPVRWHPSCLSVLSLVTLTLNIWLRYHLHCILHCEVAVFPFCNECCVSWATILRLGRYFVFHQTSSSVDDSCLNQLLLLGLPSSDFSQFCHSFRIYRWQSKLRNCSPLSLWSYLFYQCDIANFCLT